MTRIADYLASVEEAVHRRAAIYGAAGAEKALGAPAGLDGGAVATAECADTADARPAEALAADGHAPRAFDHTEFAALDDDELLVFQRRVASVQRRIELLAAGAAGEIAARSTREAGYDGLAQRLGARTAEKLVQHATGVSIRDARTMVRVGELMRATALRADSGSQHAAASQPAADAPGEWPGGTDGGIDGAYLGEGAAPSWLGPVVQAVTGGALSIEHADAIRAGLGEPDEQVTAQQLRDAAETLVSDAENVPADRMRGHARHERDLLDERGVAEREAALREQRSLRIWRQPDGMTRLTALLDPESAALVTDAIDVVTSPRRGGPRFVDPDEVERAQRMIDDERSTEQIAVDALVAMVQLACDVEAEAQTGSAGSGRIFGGKRPGVRLHVSNADLERRARHGVIEGSNDVVSIATVERHACTAGLVPIRFDDDGQALNVGREQRLFTRRQRVALAARDGGCMFPDCDRPPSWCEAHHIDEWHRDSGSTDIADGILLCRHHHLLIHNNGWNVTRTGGADYWLIPPQERDPEQTPRALPSKQPLRRRSRTIANPIRRSAEKRGATLPGARVVQAV